MLVAVMASLDGITIVGGAGGICNHVIRVTAQRVVAFVPRNAVAFYFFAGKNFVCESMSSLAAHFALVRATLNAYVDGALPALSCALAYPNPAWRPKRPICLNGVRNDAVLQRGIRLRHIFLSKNPAPVAASHAAFSGS